MRLALSILAFFTSLLLVSQEVRLELQLNSGFSRLPVAGVMAKAEGKTIASDSSGKIGLRVQKGKAIKLKLTHVGFLPSSQNVTCYKDTVVLFSLEPRVIELEELDVSVEKDNSFGITRLNKVEGTAIYAGKKSESILLEDASTNLGANNSRQLFSKVAGINVFENDGAGANTGIGGRGLNPNRISNFNTRQNGYDISADALGYPESYYSPPAEAVERIDILRGASALQYGTQFGGMINYKFRPASAENVSGNFRQSAGSFGFFNSFNQVSGKVGNLSYNTFYQYKHYNGWRACSELNSHNAFVGLNYKLSDKVTIKGEYSFMTYLNQQAGGLTDKQFLADPSKVSRERNWFKVKWNLYSLSMDYRVGDRTTINLMGFGLSAGRDALGNLGRADRADDTSANRNLMRDVYTNFGTEARLLHRYEMGKHMHHLLVGARYYHGQTKREQGEANKSFNPDFYFLNPDNLENSSYTFPSLNYAVFAENIFQITERWSVIPGIRMEYISTASEGYYRLLNKNLAGSVLLDLKIYDQRENNRSFLLGGIGNQYKLSAHVDLYANISQNYRSINFNDMRVANPNFAVDPNLKDERGYTTDGGIRGVFKDLLYFDLGAFYLSYKQRIGTTLKLDTLTYQVIRYRTNIANSENYGIEAFAEMDWLKLFSKNSQHKLSTFVNLSLIQSWYLSDNKMFDHKKVEYVPTSIFRTGITYSYQEFGFTVQYSYTGEQFSDATNAVSSSSGLYGIVPAYAVLDASVHYSFRKLNGRLGVNNVTNSLYFTRRAEGYPGPGIIPADPRNVYLCLGYRF